MRRTIDYVDGKLVMIDQTRIPREMMFAEITSPDEVADAIRTMRVRGAPAIGVAAALGVALAARHCDTDDTEELCSAVERASEMLKRTRPTAVNLFWGVDRMLNAVRDCLGKGRSAAEIRNALERLGLSMLEEDEQACRAIGRYGAELIPDGANILTHCNAGALACVAYGTALGVVRAAAESGKNVHVYADETRPRLQGMKLTCFELAQDGIPVTVITDNMAGSIMRRGLIHCVIVGADRIAANGDVANKIGTYPLAVLARFHCVPFYVAAPLSTIDLSLESGNQITIEHRSEEEVTHFEGMRVCPEGVNAINPSFDVTPSHLVDAIITEKGIVRPPYNANLGLIKRGAQ